MHTSQIAFEIQLLNQLTMQLALAAVTFESQAEVYNAIHAAEDATRLRAFEMKFRRRDGEDCWKLNVKCLEDGWFVYQLVLFFGQHNLLSTVDFNTEQLPGNRKDMEHLCCKANFHLTQIPPKWVHHKCKVKGCKEGLATTDGNEKMRRSMCVHPRPKYPYHTIASM